MKKTQELGWEKRQKEKTAFLLKMSHQFQGQFWAGWPQAGVSVLGEEQPQGGAGVLYISFSQAEADLASFVYKGASLWCISAYLPNHQLSSLAWVLSSP